jgi:spermidine/putrescine transport system permease protein
MSKIKKQLLAGPYLIWIIGFIILPLFMIVYYAFKGSDGGFTFEYVAAIAQHTNIKALLLSLRLGIICTIICLVLSYPLAMILNGLKIKNQSFVVFVFMLPMWMNFMLRILAWKQLLSKNGVINSILTTLGLPGFNIMNTSGAVVLGMVYDFLPFMLLPIYNSMTRIKNDWIEAALEWQKVIDHAKHDYSGGIHDVEARKSESGEYRVDDTVFGQKLLPCEYSKHKVHPHRKHENKYHKALVFNL